MNGISWYHNINGHEATFGNRHESTPRVHANFVDYDCKYKNLKIFDDCDGADKFDVMMC